METLRSKATKGLGWELIGSYGAQVSSFVISIFLARLLSPEEFGLVGMSMVFLVVFEVFKNFGFSSALIQGKNISSLTYSSVFYVNILFGAFLTIIIYFIAPFVADFYKNQQVLNVLRLLSVVFFLNSFNLVQSAILNKEFNFKVLTTRRLIAQIIGGVVAIVFAYYGFGVLALIIQQIVASVISTFLLWKISNWRPKLEFSFVEVKRLLNFSGYVFLSQLFSKIIREVETLIFGKIFSAAFLGFYTRAVSLNKLIYSQSVNSLSKVLFPTLSSVQDDPQRFNKIYLKLIGSVSLISLFLTGVFYLSGESLIIILFGEKWQPSIALFKIIILKGFTLPISMIIVNTLLAKGFSKQVFIVGRLRDLFHVSIIPIAFYYNVELYLYASFVVSVFAWLINNLFVSKYIEISFKKQFNAVFPNLLFTSILIIIISQLKELMNLNYILVDFLSVMIFILLFILWLFLSKSIVLEELRMLSSSLINRLKK